LSEKTLKQTNHAVARRGNSRDFSQEMAAKAFRGRSFLPAPIHGIPRLRKKGKEKGMDRVIEYRILYSSYIEDLQNQVNALVKMGWIPHSALCFGAGIYHQPMVLIEKEG
jgi:hypothetical protein